MQSRRGEHGRDGPILVRFANGDEYVHHPESPHHSLLVTLHLPGAVKYFRIHPKGAFSNLSWGRLPSTVAHVDTLLPLLEGEG